MKKTSIEEHDKNGVLLKIGDIVNTFGGGVMYPIEDRNDGVTTKFTGKYKKVGNSTRYGEIVNETSLKGGDFIGIRTNPEVSGMNYAHRLSSEMSFSRMEKVGDMDNDAHLMEIDTRSSDEEIDLAVLKMRKEHSELAKEEEWGYYLMSEDAFKSYQPEGSRPIHRAGDIFSGTGEVYIGYLDFTDFQEFYIELDDVYKNECSIWAQEITNSNVKDFDIMDIVTNNLFDYILSEFGASTERNVCALIGGISKKFDMTPIELFNYIDEHTQAQEI